MGIGKWAAALVFAGFVATPVAAVGQAGALQGEPSSRGVSQGTMVVAASACKYGYGKSRKTGECIKLKCKDSQMLDKKGNRCIAKPKPKTKPKAKPARPYRGSY